MAAHAKFLVILTFLFTSPQGGRSDCGFPGIPNGADIENLENIKYYENTTVIYRCKNSKDRTLSLLPNDIVDRDPFTGYMRTCYRGKWIEPLPRCAKDVSDFVNIESIKVYDYASSALLMELPRDGNKSKEQWNQKLAIRGNCIKLKHSAPTSWVVKLAQKTLISYYEIDIKQDDLLDAITNRQAVEDTPVVMTTSKYRTCTLASVKKVTRFQESGFKGALHPFLSTLHRWRGSTAFFVHILGFLCTLKPEFENESFEPYYTTQISIKLNISKSVSVCELRAYQPPPLRCGRPQVPYEGDVAITSLNGNGKDAEALKSGKDVIRWRDQATYRCNKGYDLETDTRYQDNDKSLLCSPDSIWTGEVPSCRPNMTCPLNISEANINEKNLAYEIKDLIFYNFSGIAVEGTTLVYMCRTLGNGSSNSTQLIGEQARVCLGNGKWSSPEPTCVEIKDTVTAAQTSQYSILYTLTAALIITLIVGSIFVTTAFFYFFKKVKRNTSKQSSEDLNSKFKSGQFASTTSLPGDKIYEEVEDYLNIDPVYDTVKDLPDVIKTERKASVRKAKTPEDPIYDDICFEEPEHLYESAFPRNSFYKPAV